MPNTAVSNKFEITVPTNEPGEVDFPRIGSYQIGGWSFVTQNRINEMAKVDALIVHPNRETNQNNGHSIASIYSDIKSANQDCKLFMYTLPQAVPVAITEFVNKLDSETGPTGNGGSYTPNDWWARRTDGSRVSDWSGQFSTNFTIHVTPDSNGDRWPQWYAKDMRDKYFSQGAVDGNFIDVFNPEPTSQINPDWNRDGSNDSPSSANAADWYSAAQIAYLTAHKQLYPSHLMAGNISHFWDQPVPSRYIGVLDGGLMENQMGKSWSFETWGGWDRTMSEYRNFMSYLPSDGIGWFHVTNEENGGPQYQFMRYGLCSTLMDNGYFAYNEEFSYSSFKWFDEYDQNLGQPVSGSAGNVQTSPWSQGVYRRVFAGGMALVNPKGNEAQTVNVGSGYRHFQGTQDSTRNNGNVVTSVTIQPRDGVILINA